MDEFVDETQATKNPLPKGWALRFWEKAKERAGARLAESSIAAEIQEDEPHGGTPAARAQNGSQSGAVVAGQIPPAPLIPAASLPVEGTSPNDAQRAATIEPDQSQMALVSPGAFASPSAAEATPEKKRSFAEKSAEARVAQLHSGVDWSHILSELMQQKKKDLEYARKKGEPQLFDALDREEARLFSQALSANEKMKQDVANSKRLSGVSLSWWTAYWRAELAALGDLSRAENHQVAKASVLSAVSAWEGEKLGAIIQAGAGAIADAQTRKEVLASGYLGRRENSDKAFWKEVQEPGPTSEKTLSLLIESGLVDAHDFPSALTDILDKERESRRQGASWPDRGWIANALLSHAQHADDGHVALWIEQVSSESWSEFVGENEGWAAVAQKIRELAKSRAPAMNIQTSFCAPEPVEGAPPETSMQAMRESACVAGPEEEARPATAVEITPPADAILAEPQPAKASVAPAPPLEETQALRARAPEVPTRKPGVPVLSGASAAARVSAAERAALRRAAKRP